MIGRKTYAERKAEVLGNPDDRAHGTYQGYKHFGCRCERCREANHEYNAMAYQRAKEARQKRLEQVRLERENRAKAVEPNPEPPKPNPVRVAKHEKAVAQKRAKRPEPVLLNEYEKALMRGCSVSYDPPRCAVCGRTYPVERHHVVKRSQGGTDGPTVMLCGMGNNLKDADGRYLCHGRAEHRMLHFRWHAREISESTWETKGGFYGEGWWEYLETKVPMKYENALKLGGWKRLGR